MSVEEFLEEHPSRILRLTGGRRMTKSTFTIPVFLLLAIILLSMSGCGLFEPEEEYDHSARLNNIILSVNNGTVESLGEMDIRNASRDTVFITYQDYWYCDFILYSAQVKTDSGWVDMYYQKIESDTGFSAQPYWTTEFQPHHICMIVKHPLFLMPSESHMEIIKGFRSVGEYRLTVRFAYPTPTPPVTEWYKLAVDYQVK